MGHATSEPVPLVLQMNRLNEIVWELATKGVPENVSLPHAWRLIVFDGPARKLYLTAAGVAEYVAPDAENGVKGYGRITFTVPPADVAAAVSGVASWQVETVDAQGRAKVEFGGPCSSQWNPVVT